MIQLELFPEHVPDTPVSDERFWQWLDQLTAGTRREVSISLVRPRFSTSRKPEPAAIVCDLERHTVRIETYA